MKRLITLIALIIVTVSYIQAQPKDHDFSMMGKRNEFLKHLKLTPEQKKQFEDITSDNKKALIDIRAKIGKNRIDLKKMLDENQIDEQKILQLVDDNSKLQSEMKHSVATRLLSIYKILDEKQKEMYVKAVSHMLNAESMRGKMSPVMKHDMKNWKDKEKEESK
jgi:Spy/CpxP family protein refolding chaperone